MDAAAEGRRRRRKTIESLLLPRKKIPPEHFAAFSTLSGPYSRLLPNVRFGRWFPPFVRGDRLTRRKREPTREAIGRTKIKEKEKEEDEEEEGQKTCCKTRPSSQGHPSLPISFPRSAPEFGVRSQEELRVVDPGCVGGGTK